MKLTFTDGPKVSSRPCPDLEYPDFFPRTHLVEVSEELRLECLSYAIVLVSKVRAEASEEPLSKSGNEEVDYQDDY